MTTFAVFLAAGTLALLVIDYYVYRNWMAFARTRARWRWTRWPYRVLMVLMPLTMPLYFALSRWWEVEPKWPRVLVIGLWLIYYLPKFVIALGLVIKDVLRLCIRLFDWFRFHLKSPHAAEDNTVPLEERPDLSDMKRLSRRDFIERAGWTAATVPYVLVGYGVFRTLYDFEVRRIDVPIPGLPRALEGLTIAQLSDLHAGSFFSAKPIDEAVRLTNDLHPDVTVITGDFVNNWAGELPVILPALEALHADLGVLGVPGNHDHYARLPDVVQGVRSASVDLLVNQHRTLRIDGSRLHVIGTDNTGFNQRYADLPAALSNLDADPGQEVRILLAHDPTFWDNHVRPTYPDIDLTLSGHTHGGQFGIELGPLRWSPARAFYPRWAGLYDEPAAERRQFLYVNRGLGTVGPPLRIGIRPEITLLTLRRA